MRKLTLTIISCFSLNVAYAFGPPAPLPMTTVAVLHNKKVGSGHATAEACAGLVIVNHHTDDMTEASLENHPELLDAGADNCALFEVDCENQACVPVVVH